MVVKQRYYQNNGKQRMSLLSKDGSIVSVDARLDDLLASCGEDMFLGGVDVGHRIEGKPAQGLRVHFHTLTVVTNLRKRKG